MVRRTRSLVLAGCPVLLVAPYDHGENCLIAPARYFSSLIWSDAVRIGKSSEQRHGLKRVLQSNPNQLEPAYECPWRRDQDLACSPMRSRRSHQQALKATTKPHLAARLATSLVVVGRPISCLPRPFRLVGGCMSWAVYSMPCENKLASSA